MTSTRTNPRAMRASDLLGLAFSALWQQRVRTILTIIGIVIGTFALVLSLSIGRGIDQAIVALFHEDDRLRKITVIENYETAVEDVPVAEREPKGAMSDAKRARIRAAMVRDWGANHERKNRKALTADAIDRLRAIPHIERVEPVSDHFGKASLGGKSKEVRASSITRGARYLRKRLVAGRFFTDQDDNAAIVNEYMLYRLGIVSDEDAAEVIGRSLELEYEASPPGVFDLPFFLRNGPDSSSDSEIRALERVLKRLAFLARLLPATDAERSVLRKFFDRLTTTTTKSVRTYREQFTIVGVLRDPNDQDEKPGPFGNWNAQQSDVLLPSIAAAEFYVRDRYQRERGFFQVVVTVDQEDHLKEVTQRIKELGFNEWSLVEFIGTVRMNVLLITFAMAFVAVIALVVAAVGITNTMIMSVLERTHEIGVMKALGARDRDIILIFLVEGVVLGAVGGGLGLALGWLASFPGEAIARSIMEAQSEISVKGPLFVFPAWLVTGVPLLVSTITILAALYPSIRAARVDPVTSLRHE
jgi:putative ABC transport system permease protein